MYLARPTEDLGIDSILVFNQNTHPVVETNDISYLFLSFFLSERERAKLPRQEKERCGVHNLIFVRPTRFIKVFLRIFPL